jgi:predicted TPR repeat methyltransferase
VCAALRDESAGAVDLAVAADVLCYISDLHPFLAAGAKKKIFKNQWPATGYLQYKVTNYC